MPLIGKRGEKEANRYLTKEGYTILTTNYSCRGGEIDIVAVKGNILHFIEVKSRSGTYAGTPHEQLTHAKYRKLCVACQWYIRKECPKEDRYQIDLITVLLINNVITIRLFENVQSDEV